MYNRVKAFIGILFAGLVWSTFVSCKDDPYYDKTFRDVIVGEYVVNETDETIVFSKDGWFNYIESVMYPEDDVLGNYTVDEKNPNTIYCVYYIESEDKEYTDTMKLKSFIGTENTIRVENLPTHSGTVMTLTRQSSK